MFRLLGVILSANLPFCLELGYDVGVVPKCERVPDPVFLSVRCILCTCTRGAPSKKRKTAHCSYYRFHFSHSLSWLDGCNKLILRRLNE